jgi:hypothetical protein
MVPESPLFALTVAMHDDVALAKLPAWSPLSTVTTSPVTPGRWLVRYQ